MQPVTVFGGTGFLGRAIVRGLIAAGYPVRIACRHPANTGLTDSTDGIEFCPADIRDPTTVAEAVDGAFAAVNTVSLYVDHTGSEFHSVHVRGAGDLARAAARAGLRTVVHVSGIGTDPASPSRYVRARAQGEAAVLDAFPGAVILRPSVLFGRGDRFLTTLDNLTALPAIPLFGRGGTRLQPVHVDDTAGAAIRAIETESPPAGVFELGGSEVMTYREILRAVLHHRGRQRLLLPVPFPLWHMVAIASRILPEPPLTRDQVILMQTDNVVDKNASTFADLEISPRGLRESLPDSLDGSNPPH